MTRVRFILAPLLLIVLAVWVRSYWRYDFGVACGWAVLSESGAVYPYPSNESRHYIIGTAGEDGRLEEETGSAYRPWLPCWSWSYAGERFYVAQWWAVSAALAAPLWWCWRRRKSRLRGFEVHHPTVPGSQAL